MTSDELRQPEPEGGLVEAAADVRKIAENIVRLGEVFEADEMLNLRLERELRSFGLDDLLTNSVKMAQIILASRPSVSGEVERLKVDRQSLIEAGLSQAELANGYGAIVASLEAQLATLRKLAELIIKYTPTIAKSGADVLIYCSDSNEAHEIHDALQSQIAAFPTPAAQEKENG